MRFNTPNDQDSLSAMRNLGKSSLVASQLLQITRTLFAPSSNLRVVEFAERFKHDLVSSSLLSITLASSTPEHSRSNSTVFHSNSLPSSPTSPTHADSTRRATSAIREAMIPKDMLLLAGSCFVLGLGYHKSGFSILTGLMTYRYMFKPTQAQKSAQVMNETLQLLDNLVQSGNQWDSVVRRVIRAIEFEDKNELAFASLSVPESSLHDALQNAFFMLETQCIALRPIISALTTPDALAPISTMYTPATTQPGFPFSPPTSPLFAARHDSVSPSKRQSWTGPSPNMTREEKRQSWLNSMANESASASASSAALVDRSPHHHHHQSQHHHSVDNSRNVSPSRAQHPYLPRRRSGLDPSAIIGFSGTPSLSSSIVSALPSPRHHLVHEYSLESALAARRYTAAHLLALRFDTDADTEPVYWQDVGSALRLLASVLQESAARLEEALTAHGPIGLSASWTMEQRRPSTMHDADASVASDHSLESMDAGDVSSFFLDPPPKVANAGTGSASTGAPESIEHSPKSNGLRPLSLSSTNSLFAPKKEKDTSFKLSPAPPSSKHIRGGSLQATSFDSNNSSRLDPDLGSKHTRGMSLQVSSSSTSGAMDGA